jgi:Rod binding domain-containing protein
MNTISKHNVASALQLAGNIPPKGALGADPSNLSAPAAQGNEKSGELRDKFTQFVGQAFFGQMLKAMRSTVGKPAYFYGGHAEEVFQGQLDQTMSEHLTKASASKFADPMFERQFPQFVEAKPASGLDELSQLRPQ